MRAFYEAVYRLVEADPAGPCRNVRPACLDAPCARLGPSGGARHAFGTARAGAALPPRVVGGQGRLVPGWPEQRLLLEQEGIAFRENGCADLNACRWKPGEAGL